ncbi:hypothetical protein ACFFQF_14605 [Haladaptatus pallidirubidus]|uniref:hypothetical protein n=1 Tax=Haladaptatus pallidirubidus TaxID=1008152 RepID=UPI001D11886F|nr:hypothetical protein [Haladaptatus pallidirubidus]
MSSADWARVWGAPQVAPKLVQLGRNISAFSVGTAFGRCLDESLVFYYPENGARFVVFAVELS